MLCRQVAKSATQPKLPLLPIAVPLARAITQRGGELVRVHNHRLDALHVPPVHLFLAQFVGLLALLGYPLDPLFEVVHLVRITG